MIQVTNYLCYLCGQQGSDSHQCAQSDLVHNNQELRLENIALQKWQDEARIELGNRFMEIKRLREALETCLNAMKTSIDVGCTEHLDAADDGGVFWYDAIAKGRAALEGK